MSSEPGKLTYNDTAHTYYLGRRRCKSVTAVAKIAPDSFALEQWRKRMVAVGMTLDPKLAERVAVDPDNKAAVDEVCEHALEIAKANDAARRGTQRHRASELVDTGQPLLTEQQRADAAAWQRTLEHHGIEILPQHVEGFALWPEHLVAGRFDRIARYRGRTVLIDLKSGENAVKYPQGTAVQLALYANAPVISAEVVTNGDKSTVVKWTTPPDDLDLEVAYVILLSDDMDIGQLWKINIAHGLVGARRALELVDWRKQYDYGSDLAQQIKPEPLWVRERRNGWSNPDLADRIRAAATVDQLTELWRQAGDKWTSHLTQLARRRRAEIETSAPAEAQR